ASSVNGDIVASVNGDKILFAKGDKVATVNGDKAASINGDIVAFAKGDKADSTKKVKVRMVLNDKDSSKMVYSIASKDSLKSSVIVIDNNKIIKAENKNEIILVTGEMSVVRVTSADDKKLVTGEKSVVRVTSADDQKPLIVVNGEIKKPAFDISNYSPESIQSISVLKGEKALLKYGDKGNNGVIEITLKEGAQIIDVKTEKIVKTKENGNKKEERRELRVRGVSPIIINSSDSVKSEIRIRSTGNFQNPIYVIDGEIMKEGDDINKIKPENIASITVLKDKSAVEKYGEKGKNGVIEVTLKK
ncbi:MAG: TonB-dependent receptor plug domain-containing protein, partial [Coriobacteriia bacterium]|nr:TonB-dependent receptor plug domain-containing protein [Coriobacteriia bacterium]